MVIKFLRHSEIGFEDLSSPELFNKGPKGLGAALYAVVRKWLRRLP